MAGMTKCARLPDRAVLAIGGADRVGFLNGLVSNDVALVRDGRAVWAALLTPQGKYLADFFILAGPQDRLLLDCAAGDSDDIARRLLRFRLRSDVSVAAAGLAVHVAWDGDAIPQGAVAAAPDPRLDKAGWRLLAEQPLACNPTAGEWDAHRIALGLPDGARDMEREKSVLLEAGFDELNGISWTKGCYMGQELTARTRYRGLLKRRLLLVRAERDLPPPGTPVLAEDGREVGEMRSVSGREGLALLRLDAARGRLTAGGMALDVRVPDWARLPEAV